MFVLNDIELLGKLCRLKILEALPENCTLFVTDVNLRHYSFALRKEVLKNKYVTELSLDEYFYSYVGEKQSIYPSISHYEISSIYAACTMPSATLVISEEDALLCKCARQEGINCIDFDNFIRQSINDQRVIKLYDFAKTPTKTM